MQSEEINVSSPTAQDIANRLFSIAARVKELSQDTNMETEQLMILLRAILPVDLQHHQCSLLGVNVILTARARTIDPQAPDVLNEITLHPQEISMSRVQRIPYRSMAPLLMLEPFIERVEAWFALLPYSYRLTRTWIIATCRIITVSPAEAWAAKCLGLST